MKINFDEDAVRRLADEAARKQAARLQSVYDRVLEAGRGKDLGAMKVLLSNEWRSEFGTAIPDQQLSQSAEVLAQGRRIEVRPQVRA